MSTIDARRTIDAIWRIESPRLIAGLTRLVRDIDLAEELAHDAVVAALTQWPQAGIPRNPGAWLMTAAKRRAIDRIRREQLAGRKYEQIASDLATSGAGQVPLDVADPDEIDDDVLRLIFIACHPVLALEARVALTLRLLGGLTTIEIARAFLSAEPAVAQRIVRAKRTLAAARVPFEVPAAAERASRVAAVLEVLYLIFNEGYAATAGDDVMRPQLCADALRLGRSLAELMPREAEAHALVALMEIQASRSGARVGPSGEPILLLDQDRSRWNRLSIGRGLAALGRAEALGGAHGAYALQAAIAACHARAHTATETDWSRIAGLYDALAEVLPSPVVQLNRAVAIGMAYGPADGLALLETLLAVPALATYHLLPSVQGDLLHKLGRAREAQTAFERAASLANNSRDRALLLARAAACGP